MIARGKYTRWKQWVARSEVVNEHCKWPCHSNQPATTSVSRSQQNFATICNEEIFLSSDFVCSKILYIFQQYQHTINDEFCSAVLWSMLYSVRFVVGVFFRTLKSSVIKFACAPDPQEPKSLMEGKPFCVWAGGFSQRSIPARSRAKSAVPATATRQSCLDVWSPANLWILGIVRKKIYVGSPQISRSLFTAVKLELVERHVIMNTIPHLSAPRIPC